MPHFTVNDSISQKKSIGNVKRGLFRIEKMLYTIEQCEENCTFQSKIKEKRMDLRNAIIGNLESTGI